MKNKTEVVPPEGINFFLHFWTCFFLDSENASYSTIFPNHTFMCFPQGKYLAGKETGKLLCIIIVVLIYIVGLFGFGTNVLNVIVLRRSLIKGTSVSMKRLLVILAVFEMCACIFSIGFSTVILIILDNFSRTEATFISLKTCNIVFGFFRTATIYLTILITIERYVVVAFPNKSKIWISQIKSNIYLLAVIILAAVLDIPWLINAEIMKNEYVHISPNTTIAEFPFITIATEFGRHVYPKLRHFQLTMNFVVPIPLLVIFNFLLYKSIHNWNKNRKSLSRTQKREINAAKMFSVIVVILFVCQTMACILYYTSEILVVIHREFFLLQILTTALNASANFVVYFYYFGRTFRQEVKKLFGRNKTVEIVSSRDGDTSFATATNHRRGGGEKNSKDAYS